MKILFRRNHRERERPFFSLFFLQKAASGFSRGERFALSICLGLLKFRVCGNTVQFEYAKSGKCRHAYIACMLDCAFPKSPLCVRGTNSLPLLELSLVRAFA